MTLSHRMTNIRKMSTFHFKQFSVDQTKAPMKINTDGVLLGALACPSGRRAKADDPRTILDIGTGTGVIALMLAQRFPEARIDAIEIDMNAAETASHNFKNSVFSERLTIHPCSFKTFCENHPDKKYDLVVSNPPFFINSLRSQGFEKGVAKHTDQEFFNELAGYVSQYLSDKGTFWVILPVNTSLLFKDIVLETTMELISTTTIHSFSGSDPHRELLEFKRYGILNRPGKFVIYQAEKEYSSQYKETLKDFFTIF